MSLLMTLGMGFVITLVGVFLTYLIIDGFDVEDAATDTAERMLGVLVGVVSVAMIFVAETALVALGSPELLVGIVGAVGLSGLLNISAEIFILFVVGIIIVGRITRTSNV